MKKFLLAIFGLVLLFNFSANGQSPLDGLDVNVNGNVNAIAVQTDGKIIIGGSFTQINGVARNNLARLNVNRTLDTTFNPNPNGPINAVKIQPSDGKILVGGNFSQINGINKWSLARLQTDGTLDGSFANGNVAGYVLSIAFDLNNQILVGGFFDYVGSENRYHLARFDKDTGELDLAFNPNVTDTFGGWGSAKVSAIVVQFDGKIVIGGKFNSVGGLARNGLARLNPTTGIADFFNPYPNFVTEVTCLARQLNGDILVGGIYLDGRVFKKVARISYIFGTDDPTFSATFSGETENPGGVFSLAYQSNGKILVGGDFFTVNGQPRINLVRLNTDGSLDTGFATTNPNSSVIYLAFQPSGKILVGGGFSNVSGQTRNHFAGLETNGTLDKTLDLGTLNGAVQIIVPQPDGKLIIAGLFTTVLGVSRNHIARLNVDGSLDTAFNPNQIGPWRIFAVALDSTGRIYVGGEFQQIGGQNRNYLARLDPITGNADSFNPYFPDFVLSIHIDSNDKVLVSGGSPTFLFRLDSTTGDQEQFYPYPDGDVYAIAEESDQQILLTGSFTQLSPDGGTTETHNRIARVNSDGSLDSSFNTDINATVRVMKLQPDGKILIAGDFTQVNGANRNYIARLNSDGSLDTIFNPNPDNSVTSITVQSNGKILVTGYFTNIGGLPRNRVARLNEVDGHPEFIGGTLDQYDPNVNGNVLVSTILPDGKVLIGGDFSTVGGTSRSNFARLTNDTYAVSNLTISRTVISWQVDGSTPQFNRARFELSTNGGTTYTLLGNGNPNLNSAKTEKLSPNSPQATTFTLSGLNLPINQEILIRATSSDSSTEKQQSAFLLAPTASNASISGKVLTSNGRGLGNAVVQLTDALGNTRITRTSSFGFYSFDEIESGQTVVITVASKRFQYQPQVVSVNENLSDVDFVPIGSKTP